MYRTGDAHVGLHEVGYFSPIISLRDQDHSVHKGGVPLPAPHNLAQMVDFTVAGHLVPQPVFCCWCHLHWRLGKERGVYDFEMNGCSCTMPIALPTTKQSSS